MKQIWKKFFSGVFAVAMIFGLLCTSAAASIQSSEYLNGYSATITPEPKGFLVVTVDVSGLGPMTAIGASTIYIYESIDNKTFSRVATYESSVYPQMMGSGTQYYEDAVTYLGKPGRYYYASVWVYAANEKGSDEKNYTTSSVRAIA